MSVIVRWQREPEVPAEDRQTVKNAVIQYIRSHDSRWQNGERIRFGLNVHVSQGNLHLVTIGNFEHGEGQPETAVVTRCAPLASEENQNGDA